LITVGKNSIESRIEALTAFGLSWHAANLLEWNESNPPGQSLDFLSTFSTDLG